ncbi:uncharacterized protein MELLADRAFT_96043 [Melampsora larici-populina 98AG31]|uniref:Uncharacterized protein n=1 Tax=Melampsora larici-populina (strain 98AG31 / pathotype 3-4-7) TaxID=747676 RepID=F4SAQ2_MELLP|nr:uncharacterized protein MELLADRAFT_96043 [Melampsora larici-populina 98AG31]EGF98255.1 hypothetical protein MELLADRAFT_96043 [Melampsora larici-populina 98AG31]
MESTTLSEEMTNQDSSTLTKNSTTSKTILDVNEPNCSPGKPPDALPDTVKSMSLDQIDVETQECRTSAATNTTCKATSNKDNMNDSTGEPPRALQDITESNPLNETKITNEAKSESPTPNATREPVLDRVNLNNFAIENSKAPNCTIESTSSRITNHTNSTSAITNSTGEEHPSFILPHLALQLNKAQEHLSNSNSSDLGIQDFNHDSQPELPAQTQDINIRAATSKDSNQPDEDNQTSQQMFLPALESSSNNELVSPTSASTDSLSFLSAMISLSQALTSNQPNSASMIIEEADVLEMEHSKYLKDSTVQLQQKRGLSPTASSDLSNTRRKIESSATSSTDKPEDNVPLLNSHKRHLSPVLSTTTRMVQSRLQTPDTEITTDKKPLWTSTTIPVYSELIAALEKAKRSDCLTTPMIEELERLNSRCKKTGNAIIKKGPLPVEESAIVVLDDNDEDLQAKYGFSFELSDSDTMEFCAKTHQNPDLTPSKSQNLISPEKSKTLPTNERDNQQQNNNASYSHMDALTGKREDSNMERVLESTPKSPNRIYVPEEIETFGQYPDSRDEGVNLIPPNVQSRQSETSSNKSKSATVVSQSTQSEKDTTDPDSTLTSIQSTESECVMNQFDSLLTANQNTDVEKQTENSASVPVVNRSPNSSTVKEVPHSTPDVVQSAESEMETDKSHLAPIVHQSSEPKAVDQSKHSGEINNLKEGNINSRTLRTRKQTLTAVVIPKYTNSSKELKSSTLKKEKEVAVFNFKFFIGSDEIEKQLIELLVPYNGKKKTSKGAKLVAWEALTSLLERRRVGEPLDQEFLDSIDNGTDSVVIRTEFNAQTWFEAIQHAMPNLFNSHSGEPSYSVGLFNTTQLKKESFSDKVPECVPPLWHHTYRSIRMSIRPSPTKVTGFLKILLDSVILTGKTFFKEPPPSETEKAKTGIEAVCQAITWLNSQKSTKATNSKTVRLLDTNNLEPLVDIGLIQQWRDLFIKVLYAYVVQYLEAKYILNEDARPEDKEIALSFKKEWKGDSVKAPTLGYLVMFACCGIRGLICCSGDINIAPAGQMLSFTVLSEWLCKQKPDFEVKEPVFKRSNQMLMRLMDGLFDDAGHFIRPEITWYEVSKNLCFDYLSHWFLEAGDLSKGKSLVFPKSSVFSGKDRTITFPR